MHEVEFKRAWNVLAEQKSAEEIVFGPCWAPKYSPAADGAYFAALEQLLRVRPGEVLLDVGCGPLARAELYFGERGFEVVGLDVSLVTLKGARERVRRGGVAGSVSWVLGDVEFLPFREDTFGVILCIGLISHLPSKEHVVQALEDLRACLKKEGSCYVDWWQNLYSLLGLQQEVLYTVPDHVQTGRVKLLHFRGSQEVRGLVQQAGLTISRVVLGPLLYAATPFYHAFPLFLKNGVDWVAERVDRWYDRYPLLARFCYSFDVVSHKKD